jgi:hypothetical protein
VDLCSSPSGVVLITVRLARPCWLRKRSMSVSGGDFDFSGKQKTYHVAASTMIRYAEYPSCDS